MKKLRKIIIGLVLAIILLVAAGAIYLKTNSYSASSQAVKISQTAKVKNSRVTEFKAKKNKLTVIFYPGALVQPEAYSIWASKLARAGYTVKIAHFPLNLAIFDLSAADKLHQQGQKFVIGGHSLGGAMASRYAHQNLKKLQGVFFLAAYPDQKGRLDQTSLAVLSITASRDGVLNQEKYQKGKQYLPANAEYETVKGGNHAGFGDYGQQKGDRPATISKQTQQELIAKYLIKWLNKLPR